jgi:hypothetical protein
MTIGRTVERVSLWPCWFIMEAMLVRLSTILFVEMWRQHFFAMLGDYEWLQGDRYG